MGGPGSGRKPTGRTTVKRMGNTPHKATARNLKSMGSLMRKTARTTRRLTAKPKAENMKARLKHMTRGGIDVIK